MYETKAVTDVYIHLEPCQKTLVQVIETQEENHELCREMRNLMHRFLKLTFLTP